jgi:L-lactate dehydrogenase complex protein LldG
MSSRDKILGTVKNNQPPLRELPEERTREGAADTRSGSSVRGLDRNGSAGAGDPSTGEALQGVDADLSAAFTTMLEGIGGQVFLVSGYDRIVAILREQHPDARRIVSGCPELSSFAEVSTHYDDPHTLENVDLAILHAHFGVAENGACWMTEDQMIERALPFITQHLALILRRDAMVADMHAAYARIAELERSGAGAAGYGFATFIAGPSKTADIEQSLVLGAHGPRSLIVFLLDEGMSDAGFY